MTETNLPSGLTGVNPLKPGQEAYKDVDGYRIKDLIKKFTAISLKSFDEICSGKADDLPESAFLYVGGIDEVREKAKAMANA